MGKFCTQCGHELQDGVDFCPNCGALVDGDVQSQDDGGNAGDSYEPDKQWYEKDFMYGIVNPVVKGFDSGNYFRVIAKCIIYIMAYGFLLWQPLQAVITYRMFDNMYLSDGLASFKFLLFMMAVAGLLLAGWSMGYWRKRVRRIDSLLKPGDDFVAIPLGSYLLQWIGEWLAAVLCVMGVFGLFLSLSVSSGRYYLDEFLPLGFLGSGFTVIITGLILPFVCRIMAESIRALAAIANNTACRRHDEESPADMSDEDSSSADTAYNILYGLVALVTLCVTIAALL